MVRLAAALALVLPLMAPSMTRAQSTDHGADEIMAAFTEWASGITGEKFTQAQVAAEIEIRPQDDHYVASVPLGAGADAPHLTADISQAMGRWLIDDIKIPDSAVFKSPAGGHRIDFEADGQSGTVILDNTFTTSTLGTFAMAEVGLHFRTEGSKAETLIKFDHALESIVFRPLLDGRTDVAADAAVDGASLLSESADAPPVKLGFDRLRTAVAVDGTTRAGTARLLQAMARKGAPPSQAVPQLPPGGVAEAFAAFTSAMSIGGSFDGMALDTGHVAGSVQSGKVVLEAAQQDGFIHGAVHVDADALTFTSERLGPVAGFLPTRFSLHQSIGNVPIAALIHLAVLSDSGTTPTPEDLQQLFAPGGMQIRLENFLIEIGGATFTGAGKGALTAPNEGTAAATISATNLDVLQERLAADPVLAKGVPLVIFLKGVGRTVDNRMVWDIAYRDRQLTVNNQNLSAMLQSFTGNPAGR